MLIVFITDLHTGLEGESSFNIDLRQNFLDILFAINQYPYDYLVIGGDLCLHDGNRDIYQWQKAHLDALGKPYFIIAGNHDDPVLLGQTFPGLPEPTESEIYYDLTIDSQVFLFLDTSRGAISEFQKSWLKTQLHQHQSSQVIIFMHHPPTLMGVPHMDQKHALRNHVEVMQIFNETPNQKHIFCGHYHVHKSGFIGQVSVHVTPSLFFQINQYQNEFEVDHNNIAYRLIAIDHDGIFSTVHYLPGNHI